MCPFNEMSTQVTLRVFSPYCDVPMHVILSHLFDVLFSLLFKTENISIDIGTSSLMWFKITYFSFHMLISIISSCVLWGCFIGLHVNNSNKLTIKARLDICLKWSHINIHWGPPILILGEELCFSQNLFFSHETNFFSSIFAKK